MRSLKTHRHVVLGSAAIVCMSLGCVAFAQTSQTRPSVYKIELKAYPDIAPGKIGMVEGVADSSGQRLAVGGLSILQPVSVALFASDAGDDLRLELGKYTSDGPVREGSTRDTGVSSFQFRTEGDVQIRVSATDGKKPYRLAVWAGEEIATPLPPAVISIQEYQRRHGGAAASTSTFAFGPAARWIVAALIGIMALLGLVILKRGRS